MEAGETIGHLDAHIAAEQHLPTYDYWLFDDVRLALMHFTEGGRPLGALVTSDASIVAAHRRWFDLGRQHATPFADFARHHPVHALAR